MDIRRWLGAACWLALLAGRAQGGEAAASMAADGTLRIGGLAFTVRCFDPAWKAAHLTSREFSPVASAPKAGEAVFAAAFQRADAPPGKFSASLAAEAPGVWRYKAEFRFDAPARFQEISFSPAALPVARFGGREVWIDGVRRIELPRVRDPEAPPVLFRGRAEEVTLPLENGKIVLRGPFEALLQDDRAFKNETYSLRLLFTPSRGALTASAFTATARVVPYRSTPLDLRAAANAGFADETAGDRSGGWTDQGADNDLRALPPGSRRWLGTDFDVIDPATNGGRSCVMLAGAQRDYFARSAAAPQAGGPRGRYLHLVHATAWPTASQRLGTVILAYEDGTKQEIPVTGHDVGDWWRPSARRNGDVAWTGENGAATVGLYRSVFAIENRPIREIGFVSLGVSVWGVVAASVSDDRAPSAGAAMRVAAGADWRPLPFHRDVAPGSALDFSGRLDAPAGKYGPVVVRGGHFEFRDRPGRPVRFYGANLSRAAQFPPTEEQAERLAERMAAAGYNLVRIHHHDDLLVQRAPGQKDNRLPGAVLSPERTDQLDRLIAVLKRRGIYVVSDLFVSRILPRGELPEAAPDHWVGQNDFKPLVHLSGAAMDNWKRFTRNWLTHVNPYTGLALKDEPALVSLCLVNEGNIAVTWDDVPYVAKLYRERFAAWGRARGGGDVGVAAANNPAFAEFLVETNARTYRTMRDFVREIGYAGPLTDQNFLNTPLLTTMRDAYDFVEDHYYWAHPTFPEKSWQMPGVVADGSAIAAEAPCPAGQFTARIFGKPMLISEYAHANPNRHRVEGPLLSAAYAALQDWDGLAHFLYSNTDRYESDDPHIPVAMFFSTTGDPVTHLAHRVGLRLFLDRELRPAPFKAAVALADDTGMRAGDYYPGDASRLGLLVQVGSLVGPNPSAAAAASGVDALLDIGHHFPPAARRGKRPVFRADTSDRSLLKRMAAAGALGGGQAWPEERRYRSSTGQIELDARQRTLRVVTPSCEALVLPAGQSGGGETLRVENRAGDAAFAVMSLDGRPLSESGRLLLFHLTDSLPTGARFADAARTRVEDWGGLPFLAARGEAAIRLSGLSGTFRLHALDTAGHRLAEVPLAGTAKTGLSFAARVFADHGTTFLYELARP